MGYRRLTYHLRNDLKVWVTRFAVYRSLTVNGSMATNLTSNGRINIPVAGLQFSVSVADPLDPLPVPQGYPAQIVWNVERLREEAVRNL